MELGRLKFFVAVADEVNFTRAASRLHVSQPAVSAQVRLLEYELGQPLLDRSGRTVRLTQAGAALLPYARSMLQAAGDAQRAVDELAGLVRGQLAVGMVVACAVPDMPKLLAGYHRRHPAVDITLSEANSDDLTRWLEERRLDVAVIGVAGKRQARIESLVIVDEPLVAAVARGDPWASRSTIALKMLQHRKLISLPRGTGLRSSLDSACIATGIRPRIAFEASSPGMLADLASRELGVAILPQSVALRRQKDLRTITITGPKLRSRIELAWHSDAPQAPAARALIAHARAVLTASTVRS